ncbi:MAG: outer membrane beta-barrel protein [Deltaproteobacteria bacterium]|nr:outer membrane beta-barrel protein [Deltaproteobacteria bacterium]
MRIPLAGLVVLATLFFSAASEADEARTHDGFHMRWGVGLVAATGTSEGENAPYSFVAPGILDGVQLGGNLRENLSLFFEADSLILFSGNKNIGTDSKSENNDTSETTTYGFLTGIGMGHYFMPANLYVSGAFGATLNNFAVSDDGIDFDTDNIGLGFTVMAGKEWWVSDGWGVGVGGQLLYMANKGEGTSKFTNHTLAFGMILTATYN